MRICFSFLLACGALSSLVEAKSAADPVRIQSRWAITPLFESGSELAVQVGRSVAIARLDPLEAYEPDVDIIDNKGKIELKAGTLLVGFGARPITACNVYSNVAHRCFVDDDNDGKFDREFRVNAFAPLLLFASANRAKSYLIRPSAYKVVDTRTTHGIAKPPLSLHFRFTKHVNGVGQNVFYPTIMSGENGWGLEPGLVVKDGQYPGQMNLYGLRISVYDEGEKNFVKIKVDTTGADPIFFVTG